MFQNMVDGSYVNQNQMGYNDGDQYDGNYGYYNQDQYNGYANQNYQSTGQTPIAQSSTQSSGRLLRKGIISLNKKETTNTTSASQQINQMNDNSYLGNQPTITKPKVNGPTQIPSNLQDFQQNITKTASKSSYDDTNYYDYQQQQQQEQPYYEEDYNDNYNDNYTNQLQAQIQQPQKQATIPVKLSKPKQLQKAQQQQLPKPPKQTSYSYNYDNDNTSNATTNYSNTDIFKQRQPMIESNFASTLDRSINNFKRVFSNEFQSIMRQVKSQGPLSSRSLFDIDEYCENLKSDISSLILTSPDSLATSSNSNSGSNIKSLDDFNSKSSTLSRKVASTIDEYTKPYSALLAEAASRNSIAADHHISELRQLHEELESLSSIFSSTSDSIVKELQRESQNVASVRDKEQIKQRNLEQKLRTMCMKRSELESRSNKLTSDRQNVESDLKSLEQKRSKWEQEVLPIIYDESGALRQKIMIKLSEIKKAIENESSFADVVEAVDDGIKTIKDESENMKSEIEELEMANKAVLQHANDTMMLKSLQNSISLRQFQQQQMQQQQINSNMTLSGFAPSSIQRSPRRQSSILSEAQERLELIKKKREEAMKIISSQIL